MRIVRYRLLWAVTVSKTKKFIPHGSCENILNNRKFQILKKWTGSDDVLPFNNTGRRNFYVFKKLGIILIVKPRKNFDRTKAYIHLTHTERMSAIRDVADLVGSWGYARLFAECIDKTHFDPMRTKLSVDEQAFEQVVSRFQQYLSDAATTVAADLTTLIRDYGVLIHDNNKLIAKKHTQLMRQFHKSGTLWTTIDNIIETPLFVDSSLTRMVQMADLCAVALRRYCENGEV